MDEGLPKFKAYISSVDYNINLAQGMDEITAKIIAKIPSQTLLNQFYYVVNNNTMECVYVSESIKELTGYTCEEWTYDLFLNIVHPDDQAFLENAMLASFKLKFITRLERSVLDSMIINYRIKHKKGHYIHILRVGYCSSVDKDNRMLHNTSMCMVITDFKHDNQQSMIIKQGNKVFAELHSNNPLDIDWKVLSKREKEVVELLCENKTSDTIAKDLFISKNTVDTHRRKILKKLEIKNTSELLFRYYCSRS